MQVPLIRLQCGTLPACVIRLRYPANTNAQASTATIGVRHTQQLRCSVESSGALLQLQHLTSPSGKVGSASAAAKFAAATPSNEFSIQDDKPYAELWMGTHPSLPSKDVATQRTLLDLVQDNQMLMGREITERYGGKLPFLFKVLSIRKALSIQAHPNKKLAEQLHAKDPKNYPGMSSLWSTRPLPTWS